MLEVQTVTLPPLAPQTPTVILNERLDAIAGFGFSDRQARFLLHVLLHSGVFVERQFCTFAGVTHGRKTHDFLARLVDGKLATPIQVGALHRGRLFHVHHKSLYAAIRQPDSRHRKPAALGRFIERVMLLDAVIAAPDFVWLGTPLDKLTYFRHRLGEPFRDLRYPALTFGTKPDTTQRLFPDKLPIGVRDRTDHVFLYLVTRTAPIDFRFFLWRHRPLLTALADWSIRLLVPRSRSRAVPAHLFAARDELATPLHLHLVDELRWYFSERKRLAATGERSTDRRFRDNAQGCRAPRFRVLYRQWLEMGDEAFWEAQSTTIKDALDRGFGRVEVVELPHQYLHLDRFVGVS